MQRTRTARTRTKNPGENDQKTPVRRTRNAGKKSRADKAKTPRKRGVSEEEKERKKQLEIALQSEQEDGGIGAMFEETPEQAIARLTLPSKREGPPTCEECISAFVMGEGYLSRAARIMNMTSTGFQRYVKRYKLLRELVIDYQTARLDEAERRLLAQVNAGDVTAIKYFLSTQGKERGYMPETKSTSLNKNENTVKGNVTFTTYLDFVKYVMTGNGKGQERLVNPTPQIEKK